LRENLLRAQLRDFQLKLGILGIPKIKTGARQGDRQIDANPNWQLLTIHSGSSLKRFCRPVHSALGINNQRYLIE
jgi:hypothetical protein